MVVSPTTTISYLLNELKPRGEIQHGKRADSNGYHSFLGA